MVWILAALEVLLGVMQAAGGMGPWLLFSSAAAVEQDSCFGPPNPLPPTAESGCVGTGPSAWMISHVCDINVVQCFVSALSVCCSLNMWGKLQQY